MAESTDLIVIEELNPVVVFTPEGVEGVLREIATKVLAHVPNIETASGRRDIASLAFKVSRSKTLLDDMGKGLVEKQKKEIKEKDVLRKRIRDFLDGLKDQVREPLTEWETAEKLRQEEIELKSRQVAQDRVNSMFAVGVTLPFAQAHEMDGADFNELLREATEAHEEEKARRLAEEARKAEQAAAEKKEREEAAAKLAAERAELDRIRAEEDAKRKEYEAKLKKEAEAIEAQQRAEREKIDAERRAEESRMRAERDKLEVERRKVEDARREQEHREAVAKAAKEAAEKAVADAKEKAEHEALEKSEAEAKAKAEAERQKALKPDKEKLIAFANDLLTVQTPGVFDHKAVAIVDEANKRIMAVNRYIIKAAQEL